mgnify:CR=1 FL=1
MVVCGTPWRGQDLLHGTLASRVPKADVQTSPWHGQSYELGQVRMSGWIHCPRRSLRRACLFRFPQIAIEHHWPVREREWS